MSVGVEAQEPIERGISLAHVDLGFFEQLLALQGIGGTLEKLPVLGSHLLQRVGRPRGRGEVFGGDRGRCGKKML